MLKKSISIFMAFVIVLGVFSIVPFTVSAATSGTTGDCTWTLDGTVLTISGNGKMGDYDGYHSDFAPWGKSISKVKILEGVTSIGKWAFYESSNLTRKMIPC